MKNIKPVEEQVKSIMGDDFFQLFIVRKFNDEQLMTYYILLTSYDIIIPQLAPDKLYDVLSPSQIDVLVGCLTSDAQ